jgi:hypothetical protein
MKSNITTIAMVLFSCWGGTSLFSQFGLQSHLVLATFETELAAENPSSFRHEGIQVSANYWFRLENIRIEFYPEISYSFFNHRHPTDALSKTFTFSQIGLAAPISIYPFDLGSDCNCPTFSKQNETFKKGFFIQVTPGYYLSNYNPVDTNPDSTRKANYFGFGVGLGLDVGLSDLITLSPIISYFTFPNTKSDIASTWLVDDIMIGFRILFRPDYRSPF